MKKLLTIAILTILFTGCAGYGTITKNLSEDGAIVRIHSPMYGSILRIGTTTNSVRVTADGEIYINQKK